MSDKFTPLIEELNLLAAELRELGQVGPHFVIFHRFHVEGTICMPGEEVIKVSLVHRGREFPLRLSPAILLLFNYFAEHRRLAQSARQIQSGISTETFYTNHGANAKSGRRQTRRFNHVSIKEYVKRLRGSLAVAFREAELKLAPGAVLKSERTENNIVVYRLKISAEWVHLDWTHEKQPTLQRSAHEGGRDTSKF
jgi:hypothetical protein